MDAVSLNNTAVTAGVANAFDIKGFIPEYIRPLFCDGKEYPVKGGDAIFIPGNVDHYTLNSGGPQRLRRIEVNPLTAARSGGAQNNGGVGTGEPPVIRNLGDLELAPGRCRDCAVR